MKKIKLFFEKILNFIFPENKNQKLAKEIDILELQRLSDFKENNKIKCYSFFDYGYPVIRNLIWNIKYKGCKKTTKKISEIIYPQLIELIADRIMFGDLEKSILVPIPLSKKKFRKRGFNQSERICKELKAIDGEDSFVLNAKILYRPIDTESQTTKKNRYERMKNVEGVYEVKNFDNLKDKTIFLIDDVSTTGATMKEAQKTLLQNGAKEVVGIVIARG